MQINVGIGSWEIVATHYFQVGLLQQAHPELATIGCVRAQQLIVLIHWEVVIDYDFPRAAIQVQ